MTKTTRSDIRLIERALRNGWDIPDAVMQAVPMKMLQIVAKGKDREAIGAARVLALMYEQNRADEPATPKQVEHHHTHEVGVITEQNFAESKRRLAERIARLSTDAGGS